MSFSRLRQEIYQICLTHCQSQFSHPRYYCWGLHLLNSHIITFIYTPEHTLTLQNHTRDTYFLILDNGFFFFMIFQKIVGGQKLVALTSFSVPFHTQELIPKLKYTSKYEDSVKLFENPLMLSILNCFCISDMKFIKLFWFIFKVNSPTLGMTVNVYTYSAIVF